MAFLLTRDGKEQDFPSSHLPFVSLLLTSARAAGLENSFLLLAEMNLVFLGEIQRSP